MFKKEKIFTKRTFNSLSMCLCFNYQNNLSKANDNIVLQKLKLPATNEKNIRLFDDKECVESKYLTAE